MLACRPPSAFRDRARIAADVDLIEPSPQVAPTIGKRHRPTRPCRRGQLLVGGVAVDLQDAVQKWSDRWRATQAAARTLSRVVNPSMCCVGTSSTISDRHSCFHGSGLRDGEREASINVETQYHSVTLKYRSRSYGEDWSDVEQRIAVAWTPCRFGGERPWFVCSVRSNGVDCGRRVTKLYSAGRLFACRKCYRLTYASQQESVLHRGLGKSQKIRMRLGGSPNMSEEFPDKPKGMHWRTYERLRWVHDIADERSTIGLR